MKNDETINQLTEQCRNIASSHMDIPPTPRDTMAVLKMAAEQSMEKQTSPFWLSFRLPLSIATAALFLGVGLWLMTSRPDAQPLANTLDINTDIGLDLVDWDIEVDALLDEINGSIASLDINMELFNDNATDGTGDSWL